jgi:hypothetical protein
LIDLRGCIHDGASRVAYMSLILKAHSSSDKIMGSFGSTATLQTMPSSRCYGPDSLLACRCLPPNPDQRTHDAVRMANRQLVLMLMPRIINLMASLGRYESKLRSKYVKVCLS